MGRKTRLWLAGIVAVLLTSYVGACALLFVFQRSALYKPPPGALGAPPASSGLQVLDVPVQGLGVLKAWWAPPAFPGLPTVVFFHGNGAKPDTFLDVAAALRRQGWGVVLATYPGYLGNPGKPSEATLMAGARATLAAVAPEAGPIIVWGHSLGSGVAARMASEGRAAGLVLEAPYTSMTEVAARDAPYLPTRLVWLDHFDTRSLVGAIHVPVLIFHSTDDPEVPFVMGHELAHRFGARATFVQMMGAGHYPHRRDLSGAVVRWAHDHAIGG